MRRARLSFGLLRAALLMAPAACGGAAAPQDWVAVRRDDLVLNVEVTGVLKAVDADYIGPPPIPDLWEYKISFMAPEGGEVKKGAPILRFDDSELTRKLQEKQNELDSAQKQIEKKQGAMQIARRDEQLKLAEAEAKLRKTELKVDVPTDLVASLELAKARLEAALAKREVEHEKTRAALAQRADTSELGSLMELRRRAQERVSEMQGYIGRMAIGSPRDGILIYTADSEGVKKKVGDPAWRSTKVVETDNISVMSAAGDVDEVDSSRVTAGQPVTLRLDAHPDQEFGGRVDSIAKIVQRVSSKNPLKVVKLTISLDKTEAHTMLPGMRFRGNVETGRVHDAVVVPVDAVFLNDSGPYVWRKTATGVESRKIQVGRHSRDLVEIKEGLAPGDKISRQDLSDGTHPGGGGAS